MSAPPIDVAQEARDLRASVLAFSELPRDTRSELSAWSVGEHLYHLCLATDLALRNVLSLVRGKGRLITTEGGPNELAVQVLTDGSYPRGESTAPRMVEPPSPVDPALLQQEVDLLEQGLVRVEAVLDSIPSAPDRIPHQNLGELNAAEWMRFAALHAAHHLSIAQDIVG